MKIIYRRPAQLVCAHLMPLTLRSISPWALATLGLFTIPFAVAAQSADRDPLNAPTAAPPVTYESAFIDYKPYQDPELVSWKAANDVVREFGSMTTMAGMNHEETPSDTAAGESNSAQPAAKPAHDMSKMAPAAPAPATQKPVSPASKPAEKQTTPGHDMSKMAPAPAAPARPSSPPSSKPAAPTSMPGMSH